MKRIATLLILATVFVGGGLSWFASSNPDGLEWAIMGITGSTELESTGDTQQTASAIQETTAVLPDYSFKSGAETGSALGTGTSGIIGGAMTLVLAGLAGVTISAVKKKKQAKA